MLKITYHGHSAFEINTGTYNLIIDPFITHNKNAKVKAAEIKADFILLTHAHNDHIGDTMEIAKNNDATIIAVHELSEYLISKGFKSHGMGIGGQRGFPFGKVKFTIAHHSSSLESENLYMGEPAGIVLSIGDKTIYHAGDTGLFLDMKLIGEMQNIDLALLPIGDNYTMGIDDAVKAAEFLNCKTASPMHYATFDLIDTNPEEFKRKVESIGKQCIIMPYGEPLEI
ncbi:MAG TPA: metal-dependent hydrolase [Ignavibacteria bacterium]|nr:metal-dependent hydrolase [Bacteroidota bacterium]HRE11921.1 metal-dependent hydrolase [Ignavibacteria bacterium]HRF64669.1 metal-dependent hydrolase [Ignavibacteria bacterium]HRJ03534.1 metal-dependent hydrolase [Ignavibacteria bacterium]